MRGLGLKEENRCRNKSTELISDVSDGSIESYNNQKQSVCSVTVQLHMLCCHQSRLQSPRRTASVHSVNWPLRCWKKELTMCGNEPGNGARLSPGCRTSTCQSIKHNQAHRNSPSRPSTVLVHEITLDTRLVLVIHLKWCHLHFNHLVHSILQWLQHHDWRVDQLEQIYFIKTPTFSKENNELNTIINLCCNVLVLCNFFFKLFMV